MTAQPFRRGRTYWARVPRVGAVSVQRSLGTENRETARDTCRFLRWLKRRDEAWLLDALSAGRISVSTAYTAYVADRLAAFITERRGGVTDALLEPMVTEWIAELARRKRPSVTERTKYERQVRTLIGATFCRSELTRGRILKWLRGLDVGQPNRYRAALSSFCEYLVLTDILTVNPVLHVPASKEAEPRRRHLSPEDALALLAAIAPAYRAIHALMIATGIELAVALQLRRRDIDRAARTVFARGTKRIHRQRTVTVYDRWAPAWKLVTAHLDATPSTPDALVFPGLNYWAVGPALRAACTARGVEDYTTHDHRHTWAVQAIRDGLAIQTVAHQLGHRDAVMTLRVYGVFVPSGGDFTMRDKQTTEKGNG